jgi:hypothetical protein
MYGVADLNTATHVAGPIIKVGERSVQRCCLCGEKLADTNDMTQFWVEGALIKINNRFMQLVGDYVDDKSPLPDDFDMLPLKPTIFTADLGSKPSIRSFPSAEIETVVPLSIAE